MIPTPHIIAVIAQDILLTLERKKGILPSLTDFFKQGTN